MTFYVIHKFVAKIIYVFAINIIYDFMFIFFFNGYCIKKLCSFQSILKLISDAFVKITISKSPTYK